MWVDGVAQISCLSAVCILDCDHSSKFISKTAQLIGYVSHKKWQKLRNLKLKTGSLFSATALNENVYNGITCGFLSERVICDKRANTTQ